MFTYYAKIKGAILCMYVHVNFCFQGGVISSKPNNMVSTDRPKLIKICCSCGQHRHVSVVVERDFQPLEVKDTNKGILRQKAEQREMGLWACLAVISPFPFYYYLWTHPQKWVDLCGSGRDPCKVMAIVSHFIKLIQFISLLSVSTFSWPPPLYFWPLFIFGQFLNFRVYQLLGEAGTYYGVRFGKNIPWATEFPFGVIRDPQYVGSILSLLACLSWVPFLYIFLWVLGYAFIIQVESMEDPATRANPLS